MTPPEGETIYTKGTKPGPIADLKLKDWRTVVNLKLKSDIGFAADYRDSYWETSDLKSLIHLGLENEEAFGQYLNGHLYTSKKKILQYYHSLLLNHCLSFFVLITHQFPLCFLLDFLLFFYKNENETLEQAQINKYKNIIDIVNPKDICRKRYL
ncbi:hypothetical protein Q0N14_01985 [Francisella tularensis subsp. mediasiatica]|nr:hypothetical protein [Francisella tularensis subsp. mediasiatica]